jgi:hypothetical protein
MGMDVYGKNPKQNKTVDEFPLMKKFDAMEFRDRWKILDKDKDKQNEYWKQKDSYEDANPGYYFRNNCWWWRPLWNYCYHVADDIISEKLFDSGHSNSGAGLNDKDAKLLGNRLLQQIHIGGTFQYQVDYEQYLEDLPENDCSRCNGNNRGNNKMKECKMCNTTGKTDNFNKSYPFDIDNVKEFAEFCIESGGFEIC